MATVLLVLIFLDGREGKMIFIFSVFEEINRGDFPYEEEHDNLFKRVYIVSAQLYCSAVSNSK